MDLDNPSVLLLAQEAMRFQFPIFTVKKGRFEQHATCTLLRVEDNFFIVTAAHVTNLRHDSEDNSIHIYNHGSNEFIRITEDIIGYSGKDQIPNNFDVSIININRNDYKNIPDDAFVTPIRLLLPGEQVKEPIFLVTGYPSSRNRSFPKFKSRTKGLALFTKRVETGASENGLDLIIELSYEVNDRPAPNGMSGGAAWILTKELPCNPVLAGILVTHNTKYNHLIAVKIDFVVEMIKAYFPGTSLDIVASHFFIIEREHGSEIHFPNIAARIDG